MIANCAWCHRELHPEDGREPVGAVSHGACAKCMAKMLRKPFWYPVRVGKLEVRLLVRPGHGEPHVSYDHPRRWDPPQPTRVIDERVYCEMIQLDPAQFPGALAEARRRANLPGGAPSVRNPRLGGAA